MGLLQDLAGIDENDPEYQRALTMARADRELLRTLVQFRRDSHLTQEDVAARLGISQPSVAAFERHDNDPKLSTLRRYAQVIGAVVTHRVTDSQGREVTKEETGSVEEILLTVEHVLGSEERFRCFIVKDEEADRRFAATRYR